MGIRETIKKYNKQSKKIRMYIIAVSIISLMFPVVVFYLLPNNMLIAFQIIYALMLTLMVTVSFIAANSLGNKDLRNADIYHPYKMKGFWIGFTAQLPIWIISLMIFFMRNIIFGEIFEPVAKNYFSTVLVLQYTNVISIFNYSMWGHIASIFVIPLVCMVGYLLAYYKIDIDDRVGGMHKT